MLCGRVIRALKYGGPKREVSRLMHFVYTSRLGYGLKGFVCIAARKKLRTKQRRSPGLTPPEDLTYTRRLLKSCNEPDERELSFHVLLYKGRARHRPRDVR